jgi:hypothetical protein
MLFGLSFVQLILWIMVIAGCIGILYVVLKQCGVAIPGWFVTICWIVAAVVVGCVAVKLLASLI